MPILCGTDFSENAATALDVAAALCARLGECDLHLLHVLEQPLELLPAVQVEAVKAATHERLEADAQRLRARTSASIHTQVVTGVASEAVNRLAEALQARLIVVASQGYSASPVFRVGGTSERIAQTARVPVLVVRDAAPFRAWAAGERSLRVLVGVDKTASSEAAIRFVAELRSGGDCDVIAGHVHDPSDAPRRYGLRPRTVLETDPELEQLIVRDLEVQVGKLPGGGALEFRTAPGLGRVGDHLLEMAQAERADVIAVGTHRKQGLSRLASVSTVVLHFGEAAVVCVPAPEVAQPPRSLPDLRRILVATDFSDIAARAVAYAYAMLAGRGGEVHLLHVVSPEKPARAPQEDDALLSALRALVPEEGADHAIATHAEVVHGDDVARAICNHAERIGADLLCVASHGKSGLRRAVFGSVADAVMRLSARPVFVVRPLPP
jgi:nucleotide-binding universal stress UspA family protein